jgi:anti-sigma28 factor (negative regulator of flagellin synthesis)
MIDGIRHALTQIDPGSRKAGKADVSKGSASIATLGFSPASELESVEINTPKAGLSGAPVDRARVDAIREAIRNNAYPVDLEKLAERMVMSVAQEPA